MRRVGIVLALLLAAGGVGETRQSGSIYTSAKTAIGLNPTLLATEHIRVMLVNGYTYSAAHDFVNDVQAFEVTDGTVDGRGEYYVPGWPSWSRQKITNRAVTAGVFSGGYILYPRLQNVTFDGIILHYWDETCGSVAVCRSGSSHPLIAYIPVSPAKTIVNQPLVIQWGTLNETTWSGTIINHSDANPANWTVTNPTVHAVNVSTTIRQWADCNPCASFASLTLAGGGAGTPQNGPSISQWAVYRPANPGQVVLANAQDMASNLKYVILDGLKVDGFRHTTFPGSLGRLDLNGCDFCGVQNIESTSDLRPDRGDIHTGYLGWTGTTFLPDYELDTGFQEDKPTVAGAQDFPRSGGIQFTTTNVNAFIMDSWIHGVYGAGTYTGRGIYVIDTLFSHAYNGPEWQGEYTVGFRSATFDGPNHNNGVHNLPTVDATLHLQDYVMWEGQDWLTASSTGTAKDGAEHLFIWHSVMGNGKKRPTSNNSGPLFNRTRQHLVVLDSVFYNPVNQPNLKDVPLTLIQAGSAIIDYNRHYWPHGNPTNDSHLTIYNPIAENNNPLVSNGLGTDFRDSTKKLCLVFTTLKAQGIEPNVLGRVYRRRVSPNGPGSTLAEGTLTFEVRTGSTCGAGTLVWSASNPAAGISGGSPGTLSSNTETWQSATADGATLNMVIDADATYDAYIDANPVNGQFIRFPTASGTDTHTTYSWNGSAWVEIAQDLGFTFGATTSDSTTSWRTLAQAQALGLDAQSLIVEPQFADVPTWNTTTAGSPAGMPTTGNLANEWAYKNADNLTEVRSWFRPAAGSPLIAMASDGGDIGIRDIGATPGNTAPIVDAGNSQTIANGGTASLTCIGFDSGTLTYAWTTVSGPGTVTFANAASASTTATFSAAGNYVLRCTVTDSEALSGSDVTDITHSEPAPVNNPPTVNAGFDATVAYGTTVSLDGTVTDEGAVTYLWSEDSGPGTPVFASDTSVDTTVTFDQAGTYVLRLTATDAGALSAFDTVQIVVNPSPTNTAPTADAGPDQAIDLSGPAQLNGFGADPDGLPVGSSLTYAWSEVSGPGTPVFVDSTAAQTSVTVDQVGTYVLRLTVSDSDLSTTDDMTLEVTSGAPSNAAPSVDLGADRVIRVDQALLLQPTITDDGLDEVYTSFWCVTGMPSNVRSWQSPGCIPYVLNTTGSDLSMTSQYYVHPYAGYSANVAAFTPQSVDPQNTHVIAFKATGGTGAWAYVDQASTPRSIRPGAAQAGPTVAVVPPTMAAGDLVVLFGAYRASNVTIAMSATGGQTWTCGTNTQNAGNQLTSRLCYAVYDGTWTADPSMTVTAGVLGMTVWMQVYRPPTGGTVAVDVAEATTTGVGASQVLLSSNATTSANALSLAFVADQDDNRWLPQATRAPVFLTHPDQGTAYMAFPIIGNYTVCVTAIDGDLAGTGESTQDCVTVRALPRNKPVTRQRFR
jgi:hypothetical protein